MIRKDDLERQKQVLELYCARQGWTFEAVADLGSGMNYHKQGLKHLLCGILDDRIGRRVVAHKDRLLRFGAELVFAIGEAKTVEVVILNPGEDTTFEDDLAKDVLEIIPGFSARLYGSRSRKDQKLLEGVTRAVEGARQALGAVAATPIERPQAGAIPVDVRRDQMRRSGSHD